MRSCIPRGRWRPIPRVSAPRRLAAKTPSRASSRPRVGAPPFVTRAASDDLCAPSCSQGEKENDFKKRGEARNIKTRGETKGRSKIIKGRKKARPSGSCQCTQLYSVPPPRSKREEQVETMPPLLHPRRRTLAQA